MIAVTGAQRGNCSCNSPGMAMEAPPENYQELNIHQDGTHSLAALQLVISGKLLISTFVPGQDVGDNHRSAAHAGDCWSTASAILAAIPLKRACRSRRPGRSFRSAILVTSAAGPMRNHHGTR